MGYKIDYSTGDGAKMPVKPKKRRLRRWLGICCILMILGALVFPKGRRVIRDVILPGDEEVTAEALQCLISDLRAGDEVSEAVTAFCHHVITESGQ